MPTNRIAIVHEWLTQYAGSERVLEQLLAVYPDAELFAVADFLPEGERGFLQGRRPRTTFLQHAPFARRYLRHYLGLMPLAIEGLDLRGFDTVISSSHAAAKGVITGPDQFHLCYCHTPLRYAWDMEAQYLESSRGLRRAGIRRAMARGLLHYMRMWDARSANGVDQFVANSDYVARRIRKAYRREAVVIPPPVDVDAFGAGPGEGGQQQTAKGDYYIAIGRMVPYKRMDIAVRAFAEALPELDGGGGGGGGSGGRRRSRTLRVIGDGPMRKAVEKAGAGAGAGAVEFLGGELPAAELRRQLAGARALVFPAEEDFGITVAESLAAGTPVILYGRGGATEIVEDGVAGVYFDEQTPRACAEAVLRFERRGGMADAEALRASVERFHPRVFRARFHEVLRESRELWEASTRAAMANRRMIQSDR